MIVLALTAASDDAAPDAVHSSREQIAPIEVTVKKLPTLLVERYEIRRQREIEKHESEQRESKERDLAANRAIWADKRISNYRYTVWDQGAWYRSSAIVVTVRNGRVASAEFVRASDAPEVVVANAEPYDTIPKLFALIENTRPSVQYDAQYGYPLSIAYDRPDTFDDEFAIFIRDFEVLR